MQKKGQAAMEFLMTYGWAILVVIVAIAALAYFGVRNPGRYLPESCNLGPGFSCNFKITPSDITVLVQNGAGFDLANFYMNISNCGSTILTPLASFNEGTNQTFIIPCVTGTPGQRFKQDISIAYTDESNFARVKSGQIIGKVES